MINPSLAELLLQTARNVRFDVILCPLLFVPKFKSKGLEGKIGWELNCDRTVLHTCGERLFRGEQAYFSFGKVGSP